MSIHIAIRVGPCVYTPNRPVKFKMRRDNNVASAAQALQKDRSETQSPEKKLEKRNGILGTCMVRNSINGVPDVRRNIQVHRNEDLHVILFKAVVGREASTAQRRCWPHVRASAEDLSSV